MHFVRCPRRNCVWFLGGMLVLQQYHYLHLVEEQHNLHSHCVLTVSVPCTPSPVWLKYRCFSSSTAYTFVVRLMWSTLGVSYSHGICGMACGSVSSTRLSPSEKSGRCFWTHCVCFLHWWWSTARNFQETSCTRNFCEHQLLAELCARSEDQWYHCDPPRLGNCCFVEFVDTILSTQEYTVDCSATHNAAYSVGRTDYRAPEWDLAITNLGGTCLVNLVSKCAVEGV